MGDAFPDLGTGPTRSRAPATGISAGDETAPGETVAAQEPLSFWDMLDIVNPLQHIPVVNHLYRALTGDTIRPPAQILGSTLFGGPLGFAVATATTVVEAANGETLATTVARAFGSEQPAQPAMALAEPSAVVVPGAAAPGAPSPGSVMPASLSPSPSCSGANGGAGSPPNRSPCRPESSASGSCCCTSLAMGPPPGALPS
jgi:hypothetical protein